MTSIYNIWKLTQLCNKTCASNKTSMKVNHNTTSRQHTQIYLKLHK